MTVDDLYESMVSALETAGAASPYSADANEPDPRYKSYGVRMPGVKAIIKTHRKALRALSRDEAVALGTRLIQSGYGEQQTIAVTVLAPVIDYFSPDKFDELDALMRHVVGWSKVDGFCVNTLRDILFNHPTEMIALVQRWNADPDPWLRRMSVVIFVRKVAQSGQFTDVALACCDNLKFAPEDLVLKGVGWALKDLLRHDKERIVAYVKQLHADGVSGTVTRYALRDLSKVEREAILLG